MTQTTNALQAVQTYQMSGLALLQNLNCFISTANTKFKDFDKLEANLGDTVTYDLPPRFTTTNSLVATFQSADQRVQSLVCNQSANVAYAFTAQQFIFNVEDYMKRFGQSAIAELSAKVEANVAGLCETAPYRFYGDGVTSINSFNQLATALAMFRNYGSAKTMLRGYLSDIAEPAIANSGLNQFALDRNKELANSWEVGKFSNCDWYQSNLLPIHTAGTEGQSGSTLTVVSTTVDANGAVLTITFSGTHSSTDAASVKAYDRFQFQDGVSGYNNMRLLTFIGHAVSAVPVQFMATADAAASGSNVTVTINPPLQVNASANQNINNAIVAGMQCKVLPSHRAGMIVGGDALYLAMPKLPEEIPFPTANMVDPDTGVSVRQYFGSLFGQNQRGMVHDALWGKSLAGEYAQAIIFPL
jgi:hypothetical protein